ncbi:DUF3370 domain-containing protein [Phormidium pseudopriestleyi FRX01]|uniref:DUF3370 domain-containing protein n=1 Tax=Phormidium pseudopriestleyi FRX01 TaxID=1759528 RepID=A0ABS3FYH8_9CYAN|nr:DUF3370 domain-containing protein [Phormidium pseudopriestleyi]MBO0352171.1 DUF3370 domain-containing protein [Phormidium pseudopriestleyi FRX01]
MQTSVSRLSAIGFCWLLVLFTGGCVTKVDPNQPGIDAGIPDGKPPNSAQAASPQEIVQSNEVRSLPGGLDQVPMFNSNSPEWVKVEGILLSTFPPDGKQVPAAHLNFAFNDKFELFAHHFTHTPPNLQTLYIGILVNNPGPEPVRVTIPEGASYLLEPDAPFKEKPAMSENPNGEIYSGPGIRAVDNVLRGIRQADLPETLVIPPGENRMLMNHPIPVKDLEKPINGRSTFLRLQSNGPVYLASLALYAKTDSNGTERAPNLQEWQQLITTGNLALPRDKTPSPPEQVSGQLIYSRVAGVQEGSKWEANLVDEGSEYLALPEPEKAVSYVISTLRAGTLGTGQSQAAKLLVRYPDTAYESHANYGVHYDLTLPLRNESDRPQQVAVTLETPMKEERLSKGGLIFRQPPWDYPFFRSTVRLRYLDDNGETITRYLHLWHRRGQLLDPLVTLNLAPNEVRSVQVDFLYPPDSVPPQVLTIRTRAITPDPG